MAATYAAAFGAIQQMPRILPGLAEVATLERTAREQVVGLVTTYQEVGSLLGRMALAALAVHNRAAYPAFDAENEKPFAGDTDAVLATTVGYHQFEGMALVSGA